MRYLLPLLIALGLIHSAATDVVAQLRSTNTNDNGATGTTAGGNVSGQTGQSENFTIQRDTNAFIGGSTTLLGGQTTTGGGGLSGLGTAGLLGGLGSVGRGVLGFNSQQQQMNTQSTTEPQVRFRMTLGFSHPRPSSAKVTANFTRRLRRIPQLPSAESVAVTMEDRTVVLAGQVDSEHEKTLIEKLAMMEPGVSEVRNELTVKATQELLPLPEATN